MYCSYFINENNENHFEKGTFENLMGLPAILTGLGRYYLNTNAQKPYAKGRVFKNFYTPEIKKYKYSLPEMTFAKFLQIV